MSQSESPTRASSLTQECPKCRAPLPNDERYITWCAACNWNVQPNPPKPPRGLFESGYASLGKKLSQGLYDELSKAPSFTPKLTLTKIAAFIVAALVHSLTLICALGGIALIAFTFPSLVAMIIGLIFVLVGWEIRPRWPKIEEKGQVSRSDFPKLYALTDRVARTLGTKPVDLILLNEDFNAAITQTGWRRTKVLWLGLPLLTTLDSQETVALLGHELGHTLNSDPIRGFFVGSAISTLNHWFVLLRPTRWAYGHRNSGNLALIFVRFSTFLSNILLFGLSKCMRWIAKGLLHLLWRDSQRAEYLADARAAQVSGTTAMLAMLTKLHLSDTFDLTVQKAMLSRSTENIFSLLEERVATVPEREFERIRRMERSQNARLDRTHPPTPFRVDLLRAHPVVKPQLVLSASDYAAIREEWTKAQARVQETLLDKRRAQLYR